MKKILLGIAFLSILITGTSGFNEKRFDSAIGNSAPIFEVTNSEGTETVGGRHSNYTLVTFWDSTDAESRMACKYYDRLAETDNSIEFVGVNFDKSEALFSEIVANDNLDKSKQYRVSDDAARELRARYGLDSGMGSVLLSPDGTVVAYNPTEEYLKTLEA